MVSFLYALFLVISCVHQTKNTGITIEYQGYQVSHLEKGIDAKIPEIRLYAIQGLLDISSGKQREALFIRGVSDPDRAVREAIVDWAWEEQATELLQLAWAVKGLSDGEYCRLALLSHSLSGEKNIGKWPIVSDANLEEQFFCAIAASNLVGVQSSLTTLLAEGEFPLSLPVIDSLTMFSSSEHLSSLEKGYEWAEEGIRASLLAAWILNDRSRIDVLKTYEADFAPLECIEMVDLAQRYPEKEGSENLLHYLAKASSDCGEWADLALVATGKKKAHFAMKYIAQEKIDSRDKELVMAALLALKEISFSEKREKKKIVRQLEKILVYDQEPIILLATLEALGQLGDTKSQKKMKELLAYNLDDFMKMVIERNLNYIQKTKDKADE